MKINLSKREIEILIKCIDTAIMFYITHKWKIYSKEKKLEGVSLNKLKEKFCIAIMQEEEDNIKEGRPLKPERMDHMEKGAAIGRAREYNKFKKAIDEIRAIRIADEKKEREKKIDEWFNNLTVLQKADVADCLWDGLSYEDKKENYECE